MITEIAIQRDASFCLWTPNVHDGVIEGISIDGDKKFGVFFKKGKEKFSLVIEDLHTYRLMNFNIFSGITEIFLGTFSELSEVHFPNGEDPWATANPPYLNNQELQFRRKSVGENSQLLLILLEYDGFISVVGKKISAYKI